MPTQWSLRHAENLLIYRNGLGSADQQAKWAVSQYIPVSVCVCVCVCMGRLCVCVCALCMCACSCTWLYLRSGMDWAGRRSWWTVAGCAAPARPPGMNPTVDPGPGREMTWSDEGARHWDQTHDGCMSSCMNKAKEGGREEVF